MGVMVNYSCSCGYEENILIGFGLRFDDLNIIREFFSANELKPFEDSYKSAKIKDFIIEFVPSECGICKKINGTACFSYVNIHNNKKRCIKKCRICSSEPIRVYYREYYDKENIICPKCGEVMKSCEFGDWD